ncbi:MAG: pyridoxamine 5'-phosphate oxidase family protein [Novosphingobium sp.]
MSNADELAAKFWSALGDDMTVMLGLDGAEDGHTRPMTAQFENDRGPIWFFTSTDNEMLRALASGRENRAIASFVAKGHDLFATIHGSLSHDTDQATIDRLWNTYIAAWYEGGRDDPKLALLRLDAERAQIWEDGSSLLAGAKMLLGIDPKKDYKDHVAEVSLNNGRI